MVPATGIKPAHALAVSHVKPGLTSIHKIKLRKAQCSHLYPATITRVLNQLLLICLFQCNTSILWLRYHIIYSICFESILWHIIFFIDFTRMTILSVYDDCLLFDFVFHFSHLARHSYVSQRCRLKDNQCLLVGNQFSIGGQDDTLSYSQTRAAASNVSLCKWCTPLNV